MRGIAIVLALGLCCAGLPRPVHANFYDGNELYRNCTTERSDATYYQNAATCIAFIVGVADAIEDENTIRQAGACIPDGVTSGQLRDVVLNWLRAHPERRQNEASLLVRVALMGAFANCKPNF